MSAKCYLYVVRVTTFQNGKAQDTETFHVAGRSRREAVKTVTQGRPVDSWQTQHIECFAIRGGYRSIATKNYTVSGEWNLKA